ncbi:hypothetical protein D081_0451 [Anaerovibrio sp. JC8]|uniref:glycosyltransferase n=1 Tax=Anaerovibrio sp. JC8 TaxID=1240085 RepID=UPI000A0B7FD2|nr:glycosyltransferase [Anaerovibrio sp. JC8]ORU01003.1 hypothetical protein D081_0451 [Anaerovibrio sp. JC8]
MGSIVDDEHIAICVPCYENPATLERLINSIIKQDYHNYTLFISDDSRKDNVYKLIQSLHMPNLVYHRNDISLGATKNCNQVINMARKHMLPPKGYIKLMHHDDFFTRQDSLRKMVECFKAHPNCFMIYTATLQYRDGEARPTFSSDKHQKRLQKDVAELFRINSIGAPSATMFRNMKEFPFFDENLKYLVDIDLYLRVLQTSESFFLGEYLISIGESDGQLTYSCLADKDLLHYEYQYVYDKFPILHKAKYKKLLWKKLNDDGNFCNHLKGKFIYWPEFVTEKIAEKIRLNFGWAKDMNINWMKFLIKRCRLNLLASIREKERGKAFIYNKIYETVKYLESIDGDAEKKEILDYLKNYSYIGGGIPVFPYPFVDKFKNFDIDVFLDEAIGLRYVIHNGKKMYMKRSMSEHEVKNYMREIYKEQDELSPHHYAVRKADIEGKHVADMGAAEGFFSLDVIDDAQKVYVFECNPDWLEALQYTFQPYRDKVEIVPKYIDSKTSDTTVAVDDYFENKKLDFIKADIEGFELPMLEGAKTTLGRIQTMLLCAYHKANAENDITKFLQAYGYKITTSPGYMLFYYDEELDEPYVRRGVIKAEK